MGQTPEFPKGPSHKLTSPTEEGGGLGGVGVASR